ncbi:MAG: hypothetical protein E7350_02460 [Clostridiales bacterium]|nr:hypothetical protein [Clostridiales bacterium]
MHGFIKRKVGVLFKVVIILLISTLVVTGCEKKYKIERGFESLPKSALITIGARSETDTFTKDNVAFDIYYGLYDIGYNEKNYPDPKVHYNSKENESILFGLYICTEEYVSDIMNGAKIPDYKTIENHYFVKEISEQEAFMEEYGFRMSRWKGTTYNHKEENTIPAEFFCKEKGDFVVKIIAYCFSKPMTKGKNFIATTWCGSIFTYETIDENTIRII